MCSDSRTQKQGQKMSTLLRMVCLAEGAEIAGDDDIARAMEDAIFMIIERRHGRQWLADHAQECLDNRADPVQCWDLLALRLGEIK